MLLHDAYIYWAHRIPKLYPWTHHTHHLSTNTTTWTAYSFSMLENAINAAFVPLFIIFFGTITGGVHYGVILGFSFYITLWNIYGHSGYDLTPKWLGRIFMTPSMHHNHHAVNKGDFGFLFRFWDWVCGTEVRPK